MEEFRKTVKSELEGVLIHLTEELKLIRTGRASPFLVENITVEAYGVKTPLVQLAAISAPQPATLLIQPWDRNIIKEIERALKTSSLGINPVVEGTVIRLNVPPLTTERREELKKFINQKLEAAKITIKNIREKLLKDLKEKKQNGDISEDDYFLKQKELQKVVDEYQDKVLEKAQDKEESLSAA